ncbi:hypothetical protein [Frigidibacter sp. MR17.24]|uniref:hypothetical protein n=1 Tax=Frigidibacter sp. MR17.24 TaxID=3127345 RepID=UPI00301309A5
MANVKSIYLASKNLPARPKWSRPDRETTYTWFDAPIDIEGVTQTGLFLHGGAYAQHPDVHVTLELKVRTDAGRWLPLERADWRSLNGGHSNPRSGRAPWAGKLAGRRLSDSHLHEFSLNWSEAEQRMRTPHLKIAREFEAPLDDFEALRDYFGERTRIENIEIVPEPPWVRDLFTGIGQWAN